jgi:glycosyltransferase involved in cell wall biosynthesis
MKTLQIGMGWLPENSGGLDRVYYGCVHNLPLAGVGVRGLVVGSDRVAQDSLGQVQTFATRDANLWQRWQGERQKVRQTLAETDCAVVVPHFALYALPILNLVGNRPLVMHFQGPWALESQIEGGNAIAVRLKWWLEYLVYQRINRFIVLSEAFRQILHQTYHVPLDRIHIVPPGLDIEKYTPTCTRPEARETLGWAADRPTILVIRRLVKRMGIENLVAAMAQVKQQHPDALLLIAGKGPLTATLAAQIETLGLADNVKLLGFVPDDQLALAYRAADFSIVPTVALEGFGLITIESLAAGTPVLGTPVDSLPEILGPLSPDLVLEGSSAEHLAKGIMEVLSGQRQLPDQAACEAYVRAHYTWPVVAAQIKAVYQLALDG